MSSFCPHGPRRRTAPDLSGRCGADRRIRRSGRVSRPAGSTDCDKFDETDPVVCVSLNLAHRSPAATLCARSDARGHRRCPTRGVWGPPSANAAFSVSSGARDASAWFLDPALLTPGSGSTMCSFGFFGSALLCRPDLTFTRTTSDAPTHSGSVARCVAACRCRAPRWTASWRGPSSLPIRLSPSADAAWPADV